MRHLSPRQLGRLSGEIANLCALGQRSELVMPLILERLHHLFPSQFIMFAWRDHKGMMQKVHSSQPGLMKHVDGYIKNVEATALEEEAYIPTRQCLAQRILFANSESHTRKFQESFYYHEILRPTGIFHTARIQIIPQEGPPGNFFCGRNKSETPFTGDEYAIFARFARPHIEHLFANDEANSNFELADQKVGTVITNYDGDIEFFDQPFAGIPQEMDQYIERALCRGILTSSGRELSEAIVRRLARKLKLAVNSECAGPASETLCFAGQVYHFSASPLWNGDKISDRFLQIKIRVQSAPRIHRFSAISRLPLSPSEKTVVLHLLDGLSHSNIADKMNLTKSTVVTHVKSIYLKLEINSRAELVDRCFQV